MIQIDRDVDIVMGTVTRKDSVLTEHSASILFSCIHTDVGQY